MKISKSTLLKSCLLLLLGIFIGCISANAFYYGVSCDQGINPSSDFCASVGGDFPFYLPGMFFGLALSALCCVHEKHLKYALPLLVLCVPCYFVAVMLGGLLPAGLGSVSSTLLLMTIISAGLGSILSTLVLMAVIKLMLQSYSWRYVAVSVGLSGFLAAFLMAIANTFSRPNINLHDCIVFFVGWQSIMLLVLGLPILNYKPQSKAS